MDEVVVERLVDLLEKQHAMLKLAHLTMKAMLRTMDDADLQDAYQLTLKSLDTTIHTMGEIIDPIIEIVKGPRDV